MIVFHSPAHLRHDPPHQFDGEGHAFEPYPEAPGRVPAILDALRAAGLTGELREAPPCADEDLLAVHDAGLLVFLREVYPFYHGATGGTGPVVPDTMNIGHSGRTRPRSRPQSLLGQLGWYGFDAQTPITDGSWEAARGAASCAIAAARSVAAGAAAAYAACRPPGHHVGRDYYGGYGFLNNAALAASALLARGGRAAILDVDYHHGNGTQEVFYEDPRALYVSLHADPDWAYPYFWGRADERGAGAGEGTTCNLPLPLRTAQPEYLAALEEAARAVASFAADWLVVSLGTDTAEGDPVGTFALPVDAFGRMGERVGRLRLPTVVVQEGGYSIKAIGSCVTRFFEGLLSRHMP